nr:uncharacterized protein LOC109174485 [Ipomoea batatas]
MAVWDGYLPSPRKLWIMANAAIRAWGDVHCRQPTFTAAASHTETAAASPALGDDLPFHCYFDAGFQSSTRRETVGAILLSAQGTFMAAFNGPLHDCFSPLMAESVACFAGSISSSSEMRTRGSLGVSPTSWPPFAARLALSISCLVISANLLDLCFGVIFSSGFLEFMVSCKIDNGDTSGQSSQYIDGEGCIVEALRNINIQGQIAVEHGQSNEYTTVMQQIARNELARLNYGYVLEFPTTDEAFTYEPIDQFNLNDDVTMEAEDEQLYESHFGQDGVDEENDIRDITQQDLTQSLILQSPMMTPYVPQFDVFEEGSSSQCPPHVVRADRSPLNQMPNAPFEHPIRSSYYNENEDAIINTSQVVNPTQPEDRRVPVQYKRRRPTRNIRRPPCGTE